MTYKKIIIFYIFTISVFFSFFAIRFPYVFGIRADQGASLADSSLDVSDGSSNANKSGNDSLSSYDGKPLTVLIAGDVMFDRYIRRSSEQRGGDYIFSCVNYLLTSSDIALANLEGPITSNDSLSRSTHEGDNHNTTFTFATSTAQLLIENNIKIVSIGNNHILNFGKDGLLETRNWLNGAGVRFFGDPYDDNYKEFQMMTKKIFLTFINYNEFGGDKKERVLERIKEASKLGGIVIVYTHWGDEYLPVPPRVKDLARQFVDAGADIVVGSHPHIVQENETYKGKKIYYSLGNFIFDQYFDDNVMEGLTLRLTINQDRSIDVQEIPVQLEKDGRTCIKGLHTW
ncbi:MAG: CapA family protein [Candidatus Paceibacterota bacterium]